MGLLDVVQVSISAGFKSFLLIMCTDAPECTTKSLSSGLRVDGARRHHFSLHGHIALAIPPLPETDPQILEHWGYADEDHLGKSFQAMDFGLER